MSLRTEPRIVAPNFITLPVADWAKEVKAARKEIAYDYLWSCVERGNYWLRKIGLKTKSTDLAVAVFWLWRDLSQLYEETDGWCDHDCLVVGDVTDQFSDLDLAVIVAVMPEIPVPREGAGGMNPKVTAVHDVLLEVANSMIETWREQKGWDQNGNDD